MPDIKSVEAGVVFGCAKNPSNKYFAMGGGYCFTYVKQYPLAISATAEIAHVWCVG